MKSMMQDRGPSEKHRRYQKNQEFYRGINSGIKVDACLLKDFGNA